MNFDVKNLPPDTIDAFKKLRDSALVFSETLLIDPNLNKPFKANFAQQRVLSTKKRDVWICISRRSGKCLSEDSVVIDPQTLKPIPISEASHVKETFTFDFSENKVIKVPCQWISSGTKKCLKLGLGSGTKLSLSIDHEVFTLKSGWIQAQNLKPGDRILAPTTLAIYGDLIPTAEELEKDIKFSASYKKLSNDVYQYTKASLREFIREFFIANGRILHEQKCVTFMLWSRQLALDIRHLLNRLGIQSRIDEDGNLFIDELIDTQFFLELIGVDGITTDVRGPRKWEIITDIRQLGDRRVYDLSVEHPDHNFICNDLVVHNSYSLGIIAIWHAITKPNQKISVFAPSSTQVNEFFDNIDKWIAKNDFLGALQDPHGGNHKNPQRRSFTNGSSIQGYLMGLTGGLRGGKRGITSDVVICDEAQLFDDEDWRVLAPIMVGDETRIDTLRCYMAGTTPDNPDNRYYKKIYKLTPHENEEVIKIPVDENPDFPPEKLERIRLSVSETIWETEYLLRLGEVDSAVFRKSDILNATMFDWECGVQNINHGKVRFIGVDWDKTQAGTNIAVFQYDPISAIVQIIDRVEVERDKFTYLNACSLLQDYYDAYQPDLVIADQGQGEVQWEVVQYEAERRGSELAHRLIKLPLNHKLEVPNPQTMEVEKKLVKPFLVGTLQRKLQEGLFKIPSHDEPFINQLLGYRVKTITNNTIKYTSKNEHVIDCCLFAMYGIWYLYENEFENKSGQAGAGLRRFNDNDVPITQANVNNLWSALEGDRPFYHDTQIPRESIFDDRPYNQRMEDFYRD